MAEIPEGVDGLGRPVVSFGWSLQSRATAIFAGMAALGISLGWLAWEFEEYGGPSGGGLAVVAIGVAIAAVCFWVALSALHEAPLVLYEHGFVSTIHPRASVCAYAKIFDITEIRGRSERYYAVLTTDGDLLRIERIRQSKRAIATIRRAVAASQSSNLNSAE